MSEKKRQEIRLLLIVTDFYYVNPTYKLFIDNLILKADCVVIGPRSSIPCREIKRIVRNDGPFDCILCEPWCLVEPNTFPEKYHPADIQECNLPIVVSLIQYDIHNLSKYFIENLSKSSSFIITTAVSSQFYKEVDRETFLREPWLDEAAYTSSSNCEIGDNFLFLPHCISKKEFLVRRKNSYRYDISVLGSKYLFRKEVIRFLQSRSDIRLETGDDLIQKLLARLAHHPPFGNKPWKINKPIGISIYRKRYIQKIAGSLVSITCDGTIGYAVRKFFEIPAYGAVLAARFFRDAEALGFLDGENCFFLADGDFERIDEILTFLKSDSLRAEQIARAGQEMVREYHTVEKRVDQFLEIAAAVAGGTLKTTCWESGRQMVVEK
jgi:hypothetical protein